MSEMIQRDTMLIGDQATFSFKTKVPAGSKFYLQNLQRDLGDGVELAGSPVLDTLKSDSNGIEIQTSFTFTSFDSGSHVIPVINGYLENLDGSIDTVTFDAGKLEVTTIQIDTISYKPFDVKEQMNYPYTVKEFLPWAGILITFVALVILVVRWWKTVRVKTLCLENRLNPILHTLPLLRSLRRSGIRSYGRTIR